MAALMLRGAPASPGRAVGAAWSPAAAIGAGARGAAGDSREADGQPEPRRERDVALDALATAARALTDLAATLPPEEAAIVEAGAMMAQDPALVRGVEEALLGSGLSAAEAILLVTGRHADAIAAIGDELLAARADDVRSLGRRAARLAAGGAGSGPPADDVVLIAHDVGPADVAEFASALAGIALAGGGATAHAAIVARSLGVPMVTGLAERLLEIDDGTPLALDGTAGTLTVQPTAADARAAAAEMSARRLADSRAHAERDQPAVTPDGARVTVLANVASRVELDVALRAGAEGVGLLRTELAFLDAEAWPEEQDHTDALEPVLSGLSGRRAIVRVLDFGADKSPPFLSDVPARGIELLLGHPDAFIRQLRAILLAAHGRDVRIMLPMVDRPDQLEAARELLERAARQLGVGCPPLGSMIETPVAARNARALAAQSDFLSIGTNDLTAATLGTDRFRTSAARAFDPRVLRLISRSVDAARERGVAIEVCGEAASDPVMFPLLVGLGVRELSVGASRVGEVRRWVRQLSAADAGRLARATLEMATAEQVEFAVRSLQTVAPRSHNAPESGSFKSMESGNGRREGVDRRGSVRALGA